MDLDKLEELLSVEAQKAAEKTHAQVVVAASRLEGPRKPQKIKLAKHPEEAAYEAELYRQRRDARVARKGWLK